MKLLMKYPAKRSNKRTSWYQKKRPNNKFSGIHLPKMCPFMLGAF